MRVTHPGYGTPLASVPVPELRRDELSGRWVLLAPGRAARPHTFGSSAPDAPGPDACPFCPGNEHLTPPEVYRTGDGAPDTPGWRVRVVPNLYPIVGGPEAGPGATWCPRAGSTPYEVRVALRAGGPRFDEAGDGDVQPLADATRSVLARLAVATGDVPYNLVVHTAPPGTSRESFHWYVEVQTRMAVIAGFEQGTGILVNTVPPEVAAEQLRDAGESS